VYRFLLDGDEILDKRDGSITHGCSGRTFMLMQSFFYITVYDLPNGEDTLNIELLLVLAILLPNIHFLGDKCMYIRLNSI
jgi:hypothetical protein